MLFNHWINTHRLSTGATVLFLLCVMRCSIGFAMLFVSKRRNAPSRFRPSFCHVGSKEEIWQRYHVSTTLCIVKWNLTGTALIVMSQVSCVPKQSKHKFVCCQSRSNCFDIVFLPELHSVKSYVYVYVRACGWHNYTGEPPSGYFAKQIHICLGVVCKTFQIWGLHASRVIISWQKWRCRSFML